MKTMDYYSASKINEVASHNKTQRNLNAYYQVKQTNLKRLQIV